MVVGFEERLVALLQGLSLGRKKDAALKRKRRRQIAKASRKRNRPKKHRR